MSLEFFHQLLDETDALALRFFRQNNFETQNKEQDRFDPVTEADRLIEEHIRREISKKFPDDQILGEEFEAKPGSSGYEWIIDPIDGTRSFLIGSPSFTTLIARRSPQGYETAVIAQPFTAERCFAHQGRASYWHRGKAKPLSCAPTREISEAKLTTTYPEFRDAPSQAAFERVAKRAKLTRYGLDAYGFMLLAMGQLDLVIEAGLQPYDYAAPQAVIEAAGGVFTNWNGESLSGEDNAIAAASEALWREALDAINS